MNLTKPIGSFNFRKSDKTSRTDFGVLRVAFRQAYGDEAGAARELKELIEGNVE